VPGRVEDGATLPGGFRMDKALKLVDKISDYSGKASSFIVYPGVAILVYEIFSRYLFDAPTVWAHGTSQRMFAVYFVIGGAYCLLHKSHIKVDIIYSRFSVRTQAIIDGVITFPFLFFVAAVFLWYGWDFFWTSLAQLECCATPFHAPLYPIKFFIPFAGLLLLLQGLSSFYRCIVTAITGVSSE